MFLSENQLLEGKKYQDMHDKPLIQIKIQNVTVTFKKSMNVLGVIFDSKLTWNAHIASAIAKAKKALFALRLLKKFFNNHEMRIENPFRHKLLLYSILQCCDLANTQYLL